MCWTGKYLNLGADTMKYISELVNKKCSPECKLTGKCICEKVRKGVKCETSCHFNGCKCGCGQTEKH